VIATNRVELIRSRLETALMPIELQVTDESHKHAGHAGARDGKGHFHVRIVSERFRNLPRIDRHRLVYDAVGGLMQTDIHALGVDALTGDEAKG
jgi:BolA protein